MELSFTLRSAPWLSGYFLKAAALGKSSLSRARPVWLPQLRSLRRLRWHSTYASSKKFLKIFCLSVKPDAIRGCGCFNWDPS